MEFDYDLLIIRDTSWLYIEFLFDTLKSQLSKLDRILQEWSQHNTLLISAEFDPVKIVDIPAPSLQRVDRSSVEIVLEITKIPERLIFQVR